MAATTDADRDLIERLMHEYAVIPVANREITDYKTLEIYDRQRDHYLLVGIGWEAWHGERRHIYDPVFQVDLIDGKFYVQYESTDRPIAMELVYAGIPRDRIVLAFHPPEIRKYTEFAVE